MLCAFRVECSGLLVGVLTDFLVKGISWHLHNFYPLKSCGSFEPSTTHPLTLGLKLVLFFSCSPTSSKLWERLWQILT